MRIPPRFYPLILISVFLVFMLIGFLLGFLPEQGGGGHGRGVLLQSACLMLESCL